MKKAPYSTQHDMRPILYEMVSSKLCVSVHTDKSILKNVSHTVPPTPVVLLWCCVVPATDRAVQHPNKPLHSQLVAAVQLFQVRGHTLKSLKLTCSHNNEVSCDPVTGVIADSVTSLEGEWDGTLTLTCWSEEKCQAIKYHLDSNGGKLDTVRWGGDNCNNYTLQGMRDTT